MSADILTVLGGLGLFLLAMVVMTEGLRALAGDTLNRALVRFTKTPWTGALFGAGVTAVVQSSSATTIAIVGFVSAGLMTFPQSLGALFGTNIGTTATGWLVALVGFKLQLSSIMLPVLFAGVMLRLFGRRRARDLGWALAGFALIFIGLDMLQGGMAAYEGVVTPADFPGDGLGGRLLLVLIGAGITLVTQSSSAGVATALTAVHSGAITFPQAAAMVIGMDVGTTATTLLATIGASPQTRRTGWSHVVYNVFTAVLALLLLDPYTSAVDAAFAGGAAAHSELSLVGFHTTFNLVGVLVVLPFTGAFARLMMRLIPERGPRFTRRLDRALRVDAAAAVPALLRTVRDLSAELFATLADQLAAESGGAADTDRLDVVDEALTQVRRYADDIHTGPRQREIRQQHLGAMHALDHLDRLLDRCRQEQRSRTVLGDADLRTMADGFQQLLHATATRLLEEQGPLPEAELKDLRDRLRSMRHTYRTGTLVEVSSGELPFGLASDRLDAVRWLHRTAYHAWRISVHLVSAASPPPTATTSGRPRRPARG